ncbi:hypothetical protein NWF32_22920 [Pseudomonas qingdaonensis]|nr:hypothetical protein [Pseudomonas qingdaonensis]
MASSEKRPKKDASPKKALIASVTGYAMDGFDLLILGSCCRRSPSVSV